MITVIVLVFTILGFFSAIDAIMNTRTSQGAIAWSVSLITFPYVAVPAYWVLGRSEFEGYISDHQESMEALEILVTDIDELISQYRTLHSEQSPVPRAAEQLAGVPFLTGNKVELLIDGDPTFASILEGISQANEYILFQFYIVHDDEIGRKIQTALLDKANQGVKVYFLYDEIGSHDLPQQYLDTLSSAGVEVHDFHTRKGISNHFQINFRNHRKVVVVDGKTSWVGGHNVGDEYLGKSEKFGHWRDTHIKLTGPATLSVQYSFLRDWFWATNESINVSWQPEVPDSADTEALILASGPADPYETASLMFVHAINSAQQRIWIATPYFVPDTPIMTALQLAGLRGVDVRILIPDKADHLGVYLAAFSYLEDTDKAGVKVYKYMDGFLHQKVILIDDSFSAIGTANFDNRSFRLNFEITAGIADIDFAKQVESMFLEDFSSSRIVDDGEYRDKPWWFRFSVRFARLFAPIL